MAEDREVLREIWEGKIPVRFSLSSDEVATPTTPESIYLMLPRCSYFPLVTEKVRRTLSRFVSSDFQTSEMWLECEGVALKWHYPIGVLYDLATRGEAALPWSLVVHFENFPKDVIHCPSKDMVETLWVNCLKEADLLKRRNQIVNCMQKRDLTQMWTGILNDKFEQFWSVNKKLMEVPADGFKLIPFRLYPDDRGDKPFIQFQIKPFKGDSEPSTLGDLVREYCGEEAGKFKVLTHGVFVPPTTPLQWMCEHLSYPDSFLHLVLV